MSDEFNAFITQRERQPDSDGPLSGMTVAVKDNISTAGMRTTCGSRMLAEYEPPYDATVVERILAAGGTIVGKTNMDEFGMGSTTETSAFGQTQNPHAPDRVAGGSSGGSAAAVATGTADVALGSDTGGSIRNPAAFCGVVGIKPTYGRVSRYGLIAYAHSLEQIGPLGRTVEDAALLLDVISGPDPRDATCGQQPETPSFVDSLERDISDLTIGIPASLVNGCDTPVIEGFDRLRAILESECASVVELELASLEHAVAAYYVLAMSEASSNLSRFDGVRYGHRSDANGNWNDAFAATRGEGFGEEVIRRILLGTFALSAGYHDKYYERAQRARAWITTEFREAFEEVDVLVSPTMPVLPFGVGEAMHDPLRMYVADANTVPINLANLPAINLPIGSIDDLPVGAQLVGPQWSESLLLGTAQAIERALQ